MGVSGGFAAGVAGAVVVEAGSFDSSFCPNTGITAMSVKNPKHAKKTLRCSNNLLLNNIPVKSVKVDFRQIVFSAFFISSSSELIPGSAFIVF